MESQSDFWLPFLLWHTGLFIVLTFGVIGIEGRKQRYW